MDVKIKSILIPTDFSVLSESALIVGLAIARRQNAEITLLHVVDRFSYLQPNEAFLSSIQLNEEIKLKIDEKFKNLIREIEETGLNVTSKILEGTPSSCICQFAHDGNFSMVVMGTHGTSGLREFFIGSEAFRVVKYASCPVLTVPGHWHKTDFKKVLFPIRMHPQALEKYSYARPIIEKNNSELILLGLSEKSKPDTIKDILMFTDQFKNQLHNDNVKFQTLLCPCDNFAEKVVNTADEIKADLIVLTANLDYDFKAYFIGPYVQQVINHSSRPVLCIKPSSNQVPNSGTLILSEKWPRSVNLYEILLKE